MQKHTRETIKAVRAEAAKHGHTIRELGNTGKEHYGLEIVSVTGRLLGRVQISCSPKDRDAVVRECRRQARRIIAGGHYA
ncbi:hypothetical protein UFOVP1324_47 [uncultured Caudovirales phage]|uniref:Uncharacterized protein n=1 Tax=uncultured Caudovirales phage TaxID=2100421 RepID=A0A6J5RMX2_9CAUD|nr:hypothetical protein UFOVP1324_47 [uncultured Caudovirales phage]